MASVTEAVKEQFLGTSEHHLSHQARANFVLHAQKDENGEWFMDEENFINAVAPKQEDYVSTETLNRDNQHHTPYTIHKTPSTEHKLMNRDLYSTRLSANNMVSSSAWQTDGKPAS